MKEEGREGGRMMVERMHKVRSKMTRWMREREREGGREGKGERERERGERREKESLTVHPR